jgi:hypothetical protein
VILRSTWGISNNTERPPSLSDGINECFHEIKPAFLFMLFGQSFKIMVPLLSRSMYPGVLEELLVSWSFMWLS